MGLSRHVAPAVCISILAILGALGIYWLAGDTLVQAAQMVLRVGAVSVATGIVAICLISILYLGWVAYQRGWAALEARRAAGAQRRLIEAESRLKEREAEVMVIMAKHDEQVIIRDEGYAIVRQLPNEEKRAAVERLLRAHRTLVIVDNFETITDTELADFLQRVPPPSKAIIATRKRHLRRLWDVHLRGLSEPEAFKKIHDYSYGLELHAVVHAEETTLRPLVEITGG